MTENNQTEYSAEPMPLISDESMPGGGCIINAILGGSVLHCSEAGASTMSVEVSAYAVKLTPLNAPGATVLRRSCGQRLPQLIPEATLYRIKTRRNRMDGQRLPGSPNRLNELPGRNPEQRSVPAHNLEVTVCSN